MFFFSQSEVEPYAYKGTSITNASSVKCGVYLYVYVHVVFGSHLNQFQMITGCLYPGYH